MLLRKKIKTIVAACGLLMLGACVNTPETVQPETAQTDSGPEQAMDVAHIPDAVPRWEPRTAAGNKSPYTVLGKTYQVLPSPDGYRQRGFASWYGRKFHGRRTSNGEIYDMYGMTAAHKSLPIPTFVQVKNLQNNKVIVVRVNDRGPFHGDRIIDLTYAAAKKLGFVDQGTAEVEVVAIDPDAWAAKNSKSSPAPVDGREDASEVLASHEPQAPRPAQSAGYQLPENTFLQAGAFDSRDSANTLQQKLSKITSFPVFIAPADTLQNLFRVRIGPITDNFELLNLQQRIQQLNLGIPHMVQE